MPIIPPAFAFNQKSVNRIINPNMIFAADSIHE